MNIKTYYLVVMHRWGETEGHSYTLNFLTSDPLLAKISGLTHRYYRGGKYEPHVVKLSLSEQPGFFLVEQFNKDRENLVLRVCHNEAGVQRARSDKRREKIEVSKIYVEEDLAEDDVIYAHNYLDAFSNEEQAYLRNKYESLIRKKLSL